MSEWIKQARDAAARGERLAMVTVVGAQGSTPRERGARMLVWPDRFTGTIGGGALERQALDQARRLLAQDGRSHALQDYPLGPLLGQCCGGHVRLLVEQIDTDSLPWLEAAETARAAGGSFGLSAEFQAGGMRRAVGPAVTPPEGVRQPIPKVRRIDEVIAPACARLYIVGAGHVGQAVARAFAPLPFHLTWLASREDLAPEAGGTQAEIVGEDELEVRLMAAPASALHAIFTHSHDLDYRLTRALLRRGEFRYLGLIGSATKRARFERRLRADGVADDQLDRLVCPLGLPGLTNKAPAVIAIALAAQLLQLTEAM